MSTNSDSKSICLVCNLNSATSSYVNIFHTSIRRNNESLASFVLSVLHPSVAELQGSLICTQCFGLFKMLEQAQCTVESIQSEILKVYTSRNERSPQGAGKHSDSLSNVIHDSTRGVELYQSNERQKIQLKHIGRNDLNVPKISSIKDKSRANSFIIVETMEEIPLMIENCHQETLKICNYECKECSEWFESSDDFEMHAISHREPYQCQACQKRFKSPSEVESHTLEAHRQKNECATVDCKLLSPKTVNLPQENSMSFKKTHVNKIVNTVTKAEKKSQLTKNLRFTCPTCGKKCRTPSVLKAHIMSHSDLRPYMCEKCGQAYKHKNALDIHIGMHNGNSPFKCNYCSKYFTQKGALMRHLPMHTGEAPYQCEQCGKRFVHHTSYNMHLLSHTGEKPYQCTICDIFLLSTSHLKRHLRVHTGEKPYSCSLCDKRFSERYNLLVHEKIHNSTKSESKLNEKFQYKCDHCLLLFSTPKKLNNHVKKLHNSHSKCTNEPQTVQEITIEPPEGDSSNNLKHT